MFSYAAADGTMFKQAWFLNTFEAMANVVVGFVGMMITGATPNLPMKDFAMSGAGQVIVGVKRGRSGEPKWRA